MVLKIHVLCYFSYIVGISICLKNLDFGPELTFDPGNFVCASFTVQLRLWLWVLIPPSKYTGELRIPNKNANSEEN